MMNDKWKNALELNPPGGCLSCPHVLQVSSGEFWRCAHGQLERCEECPVEHEKHIPKEFKSLSEIIAEHEKDPVMRSHLQEARKKLAPLLYPEGSARYERLMRGEGPRKPTLAEHIARSIFECSALARPDDVRRIAFKGKKHPVTNEEIDFGGLVEIALIDVIQKALEDYEQAR
jgi:hypothetical protein